MGKEFDTIQFIQNLWEKENPQGLKQVNGKGGYRNGRYFPYQGTNGIDVGPGFLLKSQSPAFQKKARTVGLTKKELDDAVKSSIGKSMSDFDKRIKKEGGNPNAISNNVRMGLLDMNWQLGKDKFMSQYNKFWKAVANGDYEGMRNESRTTWSDNKGKHIDKSRWEFRKNTYFQDPKPLVPVVNTPPYIAQPDALRVARPLVPPVVPEVHNVPFISVTPNAYAEGGMLYGNEGNMPNTPQEEYQDDYQSDDTVPQETPRQWDELSLSEKNAFIASAVKHGITNMEDIKNAYNELSQGQMDAAPEEEEGNKFLKGGYKPSRNIKNYIVNKEGASMKTNRSFEEEAQSFWSVLPKDVRSKLTQEQADALYSYSYNVGAGNFKHRVVPALQRYFSGNGSMEDVQRHMYATKDSQLRGLANRRAEERAMFAGSKVPVYYDTPNDTPTANMSSAWRSSRLGPVTSIDMSRGLGVVNNNSLNSNALLGPISNMRQDYPMMSEASNTLYDDDKPTLMEAPQEGSSLDRYNAIQDYLSSLGSFGYARGGRMYDKGGVTSSNGQYHVEPSEYSGVLSNVSNGNPLEVTLPDTTVIASDPRNYRSYYDPNGAGEFMDATTLGLFPNPFSLSRSASTFMQKPSWDSAWDTTKDALMFAGSTGKEAAFAPLGLMNLVDKDGVRKTYSLAKEGNYAGAAMSGLGDALNVGMVARPTYKVGKEIYGIGKELYDTGALWDKYTTFQGRFGNYGDNLLTNMYGTYARRLGLPDKARLPADAIRKLRQEVTIDSDGMVNFTGHKGFVGNPHINTTLDRPVVSHDPKGKGDWDGADTYLFPVKDLINQTKGGSLKSIEPSDAFANGAEISISPDKVTVISGDVNTLERAKAAGMQTLSSPRLRRMYARENNNYQNAVSNANSFMKKTIKPPKKELGLPYATEMQRLQSMRGTPTLADFGLLEQQTGLNAGVAPMEEYQNAINSLNSMLNPSIQDIMNGTVKPYVYPNGREVDFIPDHIKKELGLIQRANYNNVFYDPATWAEFNWKERIGLE